MTRLPVIVGFGGYNAAGRSSFHHAYRRTVLDSLEQEKQISTLVSLASIMGLVSLQGEVYIDQDDNALTAEQVAEKYRDYIVENTLIRRIHDGLFDVDQVPGHRALELKELPKTSFNLRRRELPNPVPQAWLVETIDDRNVRVTIEGDIEIKMNSVRELEYKAAGILPTGFEPAEQYNSRFHPRGLQMTILGASDAINSMGISWQTILDTVDPDEIATFACSGLGQTDEYGIGGYIQARLRSDRATSKQMALGLNSMPADFVNAYVCGNVGTTGSMAGACASFLYNLRLGVDDIIAGRHRVVICGSSEAPVNQEVLEGFGAMSALASDERLAKLDSVEKADHRRASRPFAENCGFVMGESTQYFILMDDELAMQLGAEIYGAVTDVFVNADGFKKSISSPGAGNYITLAKSVAAARAVLGDEAVRERSLVQAHGSSTPQNRITESIIFDKVADAFGINSWPVTAVKAFVGHPLGPASGDQLANTLGVFSDGILPGIKTADRAADDVVDDKLDIVFADKKAEIDVVFLNSKGFGGNNSTATVLSPTVVESMLEKRYDAEKISTWKAAREQTRLVARDYDEAAKGGDLRVIYNFGTGIIDEEAMTLSQEKLSFAEFQTSVNLDLPNPYEDMV